MKLRRTKFTHKTPRSQTEFTQLSLDMGAGFDRLLTAFAKIIEKHFGLLYLNMSLDVFI